MTIELEEDSLLKVNLENWLKGYYEAVFSLG